MVKYCALFSCLSSSRDKERSFFRFPTDERRCKIWITASGRPDLREKTMETLNAYYFLCDLHFQQTDRLQKKLRLDAVPTRNLPQDYTILVKSTQTEYSIPERLPTKEVASQTSIQSVSSKRKLLREYKKECKRRKLLGQQKFAANYQEQSDNSPELNKIIELYNKLKSNHRGNKYDKGYKLFALKIFFASPSAYKVLAKTLGLPSERTLRGIKFDISTKVASNVFNCLQSKLNNLGASGKYCIISADEVSLKRNLYYQINKDKIVGFHEIDGVQTAEPATQAYVIMARGIFSNWKQPLGYCFLAESKNYKELDSWLNDLISKILKMGFHVVAFVSDQDSNFLNRSVSVDKPYFYINEKTIYNIFDVPHLIKAVRNNLMKHNFEFMDCDGNKVTAKWEDIQLFYRQDCERAYRLAPKLTESHINPNKLEKNEVKYATQVFSNTVATAISCSIECDRLSKTASGTVKFIDLMDKAFDVLNSSAVKDPNKYKIAFAAKPHQTEILNKFHNFLSNVTVVSKDNEDVTNSIECFKGLKITLNSILSLAKDLQSDGFDFLFTRRLNTEALKQCFGSVTQQGEKCRKPTPVQFSKDFNKLYITNMLKNSNRANNSDYLDQWLMDTYCLGIKMETAEDENLQRRQDTTSLTVEVGTTDYRFDLPEKNAFLYLCNYLLKKCLDVHKCNGIIHYVKSNSQITGDNILITSKSFSHSEYDGYLEVELLTNPPESFAACIKAMDHRFKVIFENNLDSVGNQILEALSDILVTDCCECFPNNYLKKLFVRFRIYNVLRFNKRMFREKSFKRNYFSICNL